MDVPQSPSDPVWSVLGPQAKRERLLRAADEVFSRDGLDAPMPAVAAAAGAGVGSVYRQFPSKHELLAALVVARLEEIAGEVRAVAAAAGEGECWPELVALLWTLVERQSEDDVLAEAMLMVSGRAEVEDSRARVAAAFAPLLGGASREGRLRADAGMLDLRLLFAAARSAAAVEPGAWRRVLALFVDALEARPAAR